MRERVDAEASEVDAGMRVDLAESAELVLAAWIEVGEALARIVPADAGARGRSGTYGTLIFGAERPLPFRIVR